MAEPAAEPKFDLPAMQAVPRRGFDLAAELRAVDSRALDLLAKHVNPAFARMLRTIGFDVDYVSGAGAYLFDRQGRRYIDCLGGYGVFNVGRNHPTVRDALAQALDANLPNLPGIGTFRLSGRLAEALLQTAPPALETVYFGNSGAECVEVALKFARIATRRPRFVYCDRSYHGLTFGALSVTANDEFREGFGPLLDGATRIPFDDLPALERELARGDVAAFIVEPIQGKGVNLPSQEYFALARRLCERHGTILIFDEVQTGMGRTGRMWASQHWGVEPDIMVTAKALSGGFIPVGAVLSRRWIHDRVFPSMERCAVQQTTFGQNDLAMVAGLATLQVLRDESLVEQASRVGDYLMNGLRALSQRHDLIADVRGRGLMIGIQFRRPASLGGRTAWDLVHKMSDNLFCQAILMPLLSRHGVLAQVAGYRLDVIKLLPPLVLTEADADHIIAAFDETIGACASFPGPAWTSISNIAANALRR